MKKINNHILQYFFNNLMFITNRSFFENTNELHSKTNKWLIFKSDLTIARFKKILNFLYLINKKNKKKKRILFIVDENILSIFNNSFFSNFYVSSDIKESFDFLSQKNLYQTVSCIIYIGPEDDFNSLHFSIPFIGFTFQNYKYFDYQVSTYTHFHSTLLFLKSCLVSLFK